jgi:hypothetical protein
MRPYLKKKKKITKRAGGMVHSVQTPIPPKIIS